MLYKTTPLKEFLARTKLIKTGQQYPFQKFLRFLDELGYRYELVVDEPEPSATEVESLTYIRLRLGCQSV